LLPLQPDLRCAIGGAYYKQRPPLLKQKTARVIVTYEFSSSAPGGRGYFCLIAVRSSGQQSPPPSSSRPCGPLSAAMNGVGAFNRNHIAITVGGSAHRTDTISQACPSAEDSSVMHVHVQVIKPASSQLGSASCDGSVVIDRMGLPAISAARSVVLFMGKPLHLVNNGDYVRDCCCRQ